MDRLPRLLLRARAVILSSGLYRKRAFRNRHRTWNSPFISHRKSARFCRQPPPPPPPASATVATTPRLTATTIEAPSVVGPKPISTPVRPSTCTKRASVRRNKMRHRLGLGVWGRESREDRWNSSSSGGRSRMRSTGRSRQVGRWLTTRASLTKLVVRTITTRMEETRSRAPTSMPSGTKRADRSGPGDEGKQACLSLLTSACCQIFFALVLAFPEHDEMVLCLFPLRLASLSTKHREGERTEMRCEMQWVAKGRGSSNPSE